VGGLVHRGGLAMQCVRVIFRHRLAGPRTALSQTWRSNGLHARSAGQRGGHVRAPGV